MLLNKENIKSISSGPLFSSRSSLGSLYIDTTSLRPLFLSRIPSALLLYLSRNPLVDNYLGSALDYCRSAFLGTTICRDEIRCHSFPPQTVVLHEVLPFCPFKSRYPQESHTTADFSSARTEKCQNMPKFLCFSLINYQENLLLLG